MSQAPYFPLTVAANLRGQDANGIPITLLFPTAATQALDNPDTGYISRIGSRLSDLITTVNQVNSILVAYNTRITSLETAVTAIQTSGVTFNLFVNGGCLNGNTSVAIATQVTSLTTNTCNYNTILGTPTALALAVAAQCTNLATLPAYSQNSAMSGLAGWITTPTTIADILKNLEIAQCDMRAGVTQALAQSAITCADVRIQYTGVYTMSSKTITLYFYGSSIPTAFSGSGSLSGSVLITDTAGHTYTQTFNIYNQVQTGFVAIDITNTPLLQNTNYTVVLSYALTATTPALSCNGGIPGIVINNTTTCPNISATALSQSIIQFTFTPTIIDNVVYDIDLINSSGTTSGSTVIATRTYVNPVGTTTGTFEGLSTATRYYIRTTVINGTSTTVCPVISQTTST